MTLTLVVDDSITPICDRCGRPWPTDLPGGYRWAGTSEDGTPIIRLFCSTTCERLDRR